MYNGKNKFTSKYQTILSVLLRVVVFLIANLHVHRADDGKGLNWYKPITLLPEGTVILVELDLQLKSTTFVNNNKDTNTTPVFI